LWYKRDEISNFFFSSESLNRGASPPEYPFPVSMLRRPDSYELLSVLRFSFTGHSGFALPDLDDLATFFDLAEKTAGPEGFGVHARK